MKIYTKIILIVTILSVVLVGCAVDNNGVDYEAQLQEKDNRIAELEEELEDLRDRDDDNNDHIDNDDDDHDEVSDNLLLSTVRVLELLKDKDMDDLDDFVHPSKGVRFSPYGYVDTDNHLVFTADQVDDLDDDSQIYTWGDYDGSGEPIELDFNDYYDRFIFDEDFSDPQIIGNNVIIGQGNTLVNIEEVYPDGHFVELHFEGFDSQYEGMDWRSLRLVFETIDGDWYLVGIIHDEWTI
ncbi:MAG TPA: hypothetical protein VFC79_06470 [Tissierellaceae bacterium]|nr:hypothetical protein [Tissierellaceae bacterium]